MYNKAMKFTQSVFKAYDIRGKVPTELTGELANAVGRALADFLPAGEVVVGRDMRPDSNELASALIAGLIQQGRMVVDLGQITSDMIYFAVGHYGYAGGVMITASHNPGGYNGIKLTAKGVRPIGQDSGLGMIAQAITADNYKPSTQQGAVSTKDILGPWVKHALGFAPHLTSLNVGIDAGNGMAGIIVPELEANTSLVIHGLYLELDGSFPNHPANPMNFENLKDLIELVKSQKLDCGIAFDGDGDRVFLVDDKGEVVSGSTIGAILATRFLQESPGATVLYDAITSRIVAETAQSWGGQVLRTKVGHSFIKAEMRQHNAVFACEHSGHFYFKDNYNADSGLIAALCVLDIMSKSGQKLSDICKPYVNKYFDSGEINFGVTDIQRTINAIAEVYSDGQPDSLDGLTINYPGWWFNVRASNTEPLLRLNVEADNQQTLNVELKKLTAIITNPIG